MLIKPEIVHRSCSYAKNLEYTWGWKFYFSFQMENTDKKFPKISTVLEKLHVWRTLNAKWPKFASLHTDSLIKLKLACQGWWRSVFWAVLLTLFILFLEVFFMGSGENCWSWPMGVSWLCSHSFQWTKVARPLWEGLMLSFQGKLQLLLYEPDV